MAAVSFLVFHVDAVRVALPLAAVERAERACEITPLPGAPGAILGVINLHGRLVGVVDLRRRFGLAPRALGPEDALVIARARAQTYALAADEIEGVRDVEAEAILSRDAVVEGATSVAGVVRTADGLLIIEDPDSFLDSQELRRLADAIKQAVTHGA